MLSFVPVKIAISDNNFKMKQAVYLDNKPVAVCMLKSQNGSDIRKYFVKFQTDIIQLIIKYIIVIKAA